MAGVIGRHRRARGGGGRQHLAVVAPPHDGGLTAQCGQVLMLRIRYLDHHGLTMTEFQVDAMMVAAVDEFLHQPMYGIHVLLRGLGDALRRRGDMRAFGAQREHRGLAVAKTAARAAVREAKHLPLGSPDVHGLVPDQAHALTAAAAE